MTEPKCWCCGPLKDGKVEIGGYNLGSHYEFFYHMFHDVLGVRAGSLSMMCVNEKTYVTLCENSIFCYLIKFYEEPIFEKLVFSNHSVTLGDGKCSGDDIKFLTTICPIFGHECHLRMIKELYSIKEYIVNNKAKGCISLCLNEAQKMFVAPVFHENIECEQVATKLLEKDNYFASIQDEIQHNITNTTVSTSSSSPSSHSSSLSVRTENNANDAPMSKRKMKLLSRQSNSTNVGTKKHH